MENSKNIIELITEEFDCNDSLLITNESLQSNSNDCRNLWIKQCSDVSNRIIYQGCINKRPLNYPDNFKNCLIGFLKQNFTELIKFNLFFEYNSKNSFKV